MVATLGVGDAVATDGLTGDITGLTGTTTDGLTGDITGLTGTTTGPSSTTSGLTGVNSG